MAYHTTSNRVGLQNVVAKQLPEFIRAEYPTFVAFIEAYYEFLDRNNVDVNQIRDIDTTLDDFIKYFKAELAHNYPISSSYDTERYLLKHIRDQYLAKGSEASYKLLFRLLYGKDVYMDYPGKQMLRVSDGKWQQDVSLFVRVDMGDPYSMIGKTVSIQTSKKISRDPVTSKAIQISTVTANIEKVIKVEDTTNVYEFFLDRNFYGEIYPLDVIKYSTQFQGQVLPCTVDVNIQIPGIKFRPGMVFKISSGEGTPLWFKVLKTDSNGGLVTIDLIKFGLYYNTDFAATILPTSAVSTRKKFSRTPVVISYSLVSGVISSINILSGGAMYQEVPDVIIGGNGSGATAHAVLTDGVVTEIIVDNPGNGYTTAFVNIVPQDGDIGSGAEAEPAIGNDYSYAFNDTSSGFTETGYLNDGDYWDITERGKFGAITPNVRNGVITDIEVTNPGNNYTEATVTITDSTGSGTTASATIIGSIDTITIVDGGSGYTSVPIVTITDSVGNGFGAEATAVIVDGELVDIIIDEIGDNYISPVVNIKPSLLDKRRVTPAVVTASIIGRIHSVNIADYGYNYTDPTITITGDGVGAAAAALVFDGGITDYTVTNGGQDYTLNLPLIDVDSVRDNEGSPLPYKATAKPTIVDGHITSVKATYPGRGYSASSPPSVKIYGSYGYANGAYVGTIIRQFFIDAKDTISDTPALLNVKLGAVARYPGYYKTNDGFLDDSIFIQDSYYYQTFSYVIRIDEQLQTYASVVRTMLHPSGMALFGEYSINNTVQLGIALDSLVKSLGITLYDECIIDDEAIAKLATKNITDDVSIVYPYDLLLHVNVVKAVQDSVTPSQVLFIKTFTKKVLDYASAADLTTLKFTKSLADAQTLVDTNIAKDLTKSFEDSRAVLDIVAIAVGLNNITDNITDTGYIESGYLHASPYDQGGYFSEDFNEGRLRDFSS